MSDFVEKDSLREDPARIHEPEAHERIAVHVFPNRYHRARVSSTATVGLTLAENCSRELNDRHEPNLPRYLDMRSICW